MKRIKTPVTNPVASNPEAAPAPKGSADQSTESYSPRLCPVLAYLATHKLPVVSAAKQRKFRGIAKAIGVDSGDIAFSHYSRQSLRLTADVRTGDCTKVRHLSGSNVTAVISGTSVGVVLAYCYQQAVLRIATCLRMIVDSADQDAWGEVQRLATYREGDKDKLNASMLRAALKHAGLQCEELEAVESAVADKRAEGAEDVAEYARTKYLEFIRGDFPLGWKDTEAKPLPGIVTGAEYETALLKLFPAASAETVRKQKAMQAQVTALAS